MLKNKTKKNTMLKKEKEKTIAKLRLVSQT
jgi:hypothetical protein